MSTLAIHPPSHIHTNSSTHTQRQHGTHRTPVGGQLTCLLVCRLKALCKAKAKQTEVTVEVFLCVLRLFVCNVEYISMLNLFSISLHKVVTLLPELLEAVAFLQRCDAIRLQMNTLWRTFLFLERSSFVVTFQHVTSYDVLCTNVLINTEETPTFKYWERKKSPVPYLYGYVSLNADRVQITGQHSVLLLYHV